MASVNDFERQSMGNICVNPLGDYNNAYTYMYLDGVSYNGGFYISLKDNLIGIAPTLNTSDENWFCSSISGEASEDYIRMYQEVIQNAKKVESDKESVENDTQYVEQIKNDVSLIQSDVNRKASQISSDKEAVLNAKKSVDNSEANVTQMKEEVNQSVTEFSNVVNQSTQESITKIKNEADKYYLQKNEDVDIEIEESKNSAISLINQFGTENVNKIVSKSTEQINLISQEGKFQIQNVINVGAENKNAINTISEQKIQEITDKGTEQVGLVTQEGNTQKGLVTQEGIKQVGLVQEAAEAITENADQIWKNELYSRHRATGIMLEANGTGEVEIQDGTDSKMEIEIDGKTEQGENPSPNNPQVIKGVGGMGYFDGELLQGYWNSSSPGEYVKADNFVCNANKISCKNGDVISIKTENYSNGDSGIIFYDANGTYLSWFKGLSTNAPENARYFNFRIEKIGITPQTAGHITVTINGKYQTGVEVMGANLFDASKLPSKTQGGATGTNNGDGSFTISGSGNASENVVIRTGDLADYFKSALKPGKLKINASITNPAFYVNIYYQENGERVLKQLKSNGTLEIDLIDENISAITSANIGFTCAINASINPGTIRPMLYQDGDGTYQPYHHTTLTIPLTSPLYSGDKICYVKPGESYVDADGDTVIADRILYGVYRENAVIKSYNSEEIPGEYKSSAGELTTGAEVVYKLAQPWFEPFVDQTGIYNLFTIDSYTRVVSKEKETIPDLKVEYITDTKKYIDKKVSEAITQAITIAQV